MVSFEKFKEFIADMNKESAEYGYSAEELYQEYLENQYFSFTSKDWMLKELY